MAKIIDYSNRGMTFETMIKIQNKRYELNGYGCVQKISTPTGKKKNGEIWRKKSTIDFLGALLRFSIAFDAKDDTLRRIADIVIDNKDLKKVLEHILP